MYYVYLTYTFIYTIFSTDSQLRINLPTKILLLRQQEKCYVLKILLFSVFCLFNLPTNRKQKTVRFLNYPFSLKKFYYIIYIYIILYNNIILENTYPFKNQTVFCFLFVSFVNKCLFLNKVDSLRAWFNLKYVYVLKSLTMTSKKIDCLS